MFFLWIDLNVTWSLTGRKQTDDPRTKCENEYLDLREMKSQIEGRKNYIIRNSTSYIFH
jgi:hypothetical protein